jgi:hypothetical protein
MVLSPSWCTTEKRDNSKMSNSAIKFWGEADEAHLVKSIARNDVETIKRHIAMYEDNVKNLKKPLYVDHAKKMLRLSKVALEIKQGK